MLTKERLSEILHYNQDTGIFTFLYSRGSAKAGKIAGYIRWDGYCCIRVDGKLYLAHRLAWLYVTGKWPVSGIDHINGDTGLNSFVNLRECNQSLNNGNRKLEKTNTSGHKGVSWCKRRCKWRAYIVDRGKQIHLGYFEMASHAAEAYIAASIKVFGEFARSA